jgi:hypothetical protein
MLSIVKSFHQNGGATSGAHAAQALALRERLRCASDSYKSSIVHLQFFFFGSELSGLGYMGCKNQG